ncbi:hypothetical protein C8R47DRAFT_1078772 [Mycena vitilis]|nr:hypothetical protein C8R47DRAFT_1078772 [Mycena vitilis]
MAKKKLARAPQPSAQALAEQNAIWLGNAVDDGPLHIHTERPKTTFATIEAHDPAPAVLNAAQRLVASANRNQCLYTWDRQRMEFIPCAYPSSTTTREEKFRAPSGFRYVPHSLLPECPHFGNPDRTAVECRMTPHQVTRDGIATYYLQVDPQFHPCPFIFVLRDRQPRSLIDAKPTIKNEVKNEVKAEDEPFFSLTPLDRYPPATPSSGGRRVIKNEFKDEPLFSSTPLDCYRPASRDQRRHKPYQYSTQKQGLGPRGVGRNAVAGPSQPLPRLVINLADDDDGAAPLYHPTPPAPSAAFLSAHPELPRYNHAEADANRVEDAPLMQVLLAQVTNQQDTKEYGGHFWLREGPNTSVYLDVDFPARLFPYCSGERLANRLAAEGPVGPASITRFLMRLGTTEGVPSATYIHFLTDLRVCPVCSLRFTAPALNQHLARDGNFHRCGNVPSLRITSPVGTQAYGRILEPQPFPVGPRPNRPATAVYAEFTLLTALGIAVRALDTVLGLPDEVYRAVMAGMVACHDCNKVRTVHAHVAHRPHNQCADIGPGTSSFIVVSSRQVAEIGADGERTVIDVDEQ